MGDSTDETGQVKALIPEKAVDGDTGDTRETQEDLAVELERLRKEAADSYDRYLRERAETENFKKRLQREKVDAIRFATEPLVRDLLPVVDNLERALSHCGPSDTAVREGLELVLRSLLEVLERHNVRRIESEGASFDPTYHEAIAQTESAEHAPNAVTQQHQVGYLLNDRLLRPALVTVNAPNAGSDAVESKRNSD